MDQVKPRRRDAEHNRAVILETARTVFADRGAGVDVREIARTAGVGMGTLYRHFPTKDLLIDAVLADLDAQWRDTAGTLLDLDDPWHALRWFMEDTLERHATHRGLLESFSACFDALPEKGSSYVVHIEPVVVELLARLHRAGTIRHDITANDIAVLTIAIGKVIEVTESSMPGTWRRTLDVVLAGIRA